MTALDVHYEIVAQAGLDHRSPDEPDVAVSLHEVAKANEVDHLMREGRLR